MTTPKQETPELLHYEHEGRIVPMCCDDLPSAMTTQMATNVTCPACRAAILRAWGIAAREAELVWLLENARNEMAAYRATQGWKLNSWDFSEVQSDIDAALARHGHEAGGGVSNEEATHRENEKVPEPSPASPEPQGQRLVREFGEFRDKLKADAIASPEPQGETIPYERGPHLPDWPDANYSSASPAPVPPDAEVEKMLRDLYEAGNNDEAYNEQEARVRTAWLADRQRIAVLLKVVEDTADQIERQNLVSNRQQERIIELDRDLAECRQTLSATKGASQ